MTKVKVRVYYQGNWKDQDIIVPHEFNFPSSRVNHLDALHEWVRQHFYDKRSAIGYPVVPTIFYITEISGKSVFNI